MSYIGVQRELGPGPETAKHFETPWSDLKQSDVTATARPISQQAERQSLRPIDGELHGSQARILDI
jgi:hypothetical protein